MASDDENDKEKIYAPLENAFEDPINYHLEFQQFPAEESSEESESEDISNNSDPDNENDGEVEIQPESYVQGILDEIEKSRTEECILTTEETEIIEKCNNPELKKLLSLNRSKHFMLMQLFKKIKDSLINCKKGIQSASKLYEANQKHHFMQITQLGAPYFKTKKTMFSPVPNKDTLTKKANGEITIYQNIMPRKWSENQGDNLVRGVKLTYNHNKQKAILKKIAPLRFKLEREMENSELASQINQQIEQLEAELENLREIGENDVPTLGDDSYIDWEHIASEYLKDKHCAHECRSFWHIYLHPSINKSNWTAEENIKIKDLVIEHNRQNWDQIALELGTNRSGFSLFLHYRTALCEQFCKGRFTKQEDNQILDLVEKLRIGTFIPWSAIESYFPNRSRNQLVHRHKYFLSNQGFETGAFTDAEDILLLILVDRFGRNYAKFWHLIPKRSYMQVKSRYDVHLQTFKPKGCFTPEEDQALIDYIEGPHGDRIGQISRAMGRKRYSILQRYKTLKMFLAKNPKADLKDAPRRNIIKNDDADRKLEFLKCIADGFKDHDDIPSLQEIEEKLGYKSCSLNLKINHNYDIDNLLTNFFSTSCKMRRQNVTTVSGIREAASSITQIFTKWNVKLKIPTEIEKNNHFDVVDIEILNVLRKTDQFEQTSSDLIPANLNTVIGLRSLLLKNQLYKRTKKREKLGLMDNIPLVRKHDQSFTSKLSNIQKEICPNKMEIIENERCSFLDRFVSLFMWPAIFSIEAPSVNLLNSELGIPNETEKVTKRKCVKNRKSKEPPAKKVKICNKPEQSGTRVSSRAKRFSTRLKGTTADPELSVEKNIPSTSHIREVPKNLRKVDKSEIENLIKNKKPIKLFVIQKEKMTDGSYKTFTNQQKVVQFQTKDDKKPLDINILDVVSLAKAVKGESSKFNENSNNSVDEVLKDNIKQYSGRISSKLLSNKAQNFANDEEDLSKLNEFLNCQDSVVDLTEEDIMKNEIDLLNDLIKNESMS